LQTVSGNEIVTDGDNKNADDGEEGKN